ncbi:MAG: hypothetical protein C0490_02755 [Marivirga sp.]|nr:hypothetical protein [Marivirga sp.]
MKKAAVIIVVLLAAIVNFTFAQEPAIVTSDKPGWHKIGEVKASFKTESESISVFGKDQFKSIKLKVTDAAININKIIVMYESGDTQEIPISGTLKAGAETGEFRLKNPADELQKITFTYKSEPNVDENKAHVELYGLK